MCHRYAIPARVPLIFESHSETKGDHSLGIAEPRCHPDVARPTVIVDEINRTRTPRTEYRQSSVKHKRERPGGIAIRKDALMSTGLSSAQI